MKLIRFALISLAFVLSGTAFGQSNLPACTGNDTTKWNNCFGSWTAANGNKYVGEFKDGNFNGQGTLRWVTGENYVGEFKDGNLNGQGTLRWVSGENYVGEFKDRKRNGYGTNTYQNGEKYEGEFKDDKRNGYGTFTFANGDKYEGQFKDGAKHGQGRTTLPNGFIGIGEYENNKPDGRFISYKSDGTIDFSGIMKDGKLVTSQYIDPNSFTRIAKSSTVPAVTEAQRLES